MKIGGFELRAGVGCFKRRKARLHNSLEGGAEGAALGMAKNTRHALKVRNTSKHKTRFQRVLYLGNFPRASPSRL